MDYINVEDYDLVPKNLELSPAGLPAHQIEDKGRLALVCLNIVRAIRMYAAIDPESLKLFDIDDQAFGMDLAAREKYERAKDAYSKVLQLERTIDAVQKLLSKRLSILENEWWDESEAREFVPAGLMRLDRDQDAYKTCEATLCEDEADPRYTWQSQYGENTFEHPDTMIKSKNALFGTLNSLLLLKIKLCLDLRDIYNEDRMLKKFVVNKKGKNGGGGVAMGLRSEVIDMIKWYTVRSHIVRDRRYLVENNGFVASPGVWVLKKQIRKLARAVYDNSEYTGESIGQNKMQGKYMMA
ncbi:hypothetical protein SGCOL_004259 [Colletotrichum sp. CLE4]